MANIDGHQWSRETCQKKYEAIITVVYYQKLAVFSKVTPAPATAPKMGFCTFLGYFSGIFGRGFPCARFGDSASDVDCQLNLFRLRIYHEPLAQPHPDPHPCQRQRVGTSRKWSRKPEKKQTHTSWEIKLTKRSPSPSPVLRLFLVLGILHLVSRVSRRVASRLGIRKYLIEEIWSQLLRKRNS